MIANPLSEGLGHVKESFSSLQFKGVGCIPSTILALVLVIVGVILLLLWPYGIVAVVEDMIRQFMNRTRYEMGTVSNMARLPYLMALGLYFVVWLPFAILSLPLLVLGWIGSVFAD